MLRLHTLQRACIKLFFATITVVSVLFLIVGCAINPATGRPDLVTMTEKKEIKIGGDLHKKIIQTTPIYQDKALQAYIDKVGQRVAKNSDRPKLKYHFTILDSPDINAFALPGGYIYIARGLISYLHDEAQLAAVLAHEVAHVTARHTVRQKTAKAGANVAVVLSVLTTGSSSIADVTDLWSTAAVLGYGREMELEADRFGAKYLFNSGYDPSAMERVIGVLKNQETFARRRAREAGKKAKSYHGVFSTHPQNDKRLRGVIAEAGKLPDNAGAITNETEFRKHVDGMIYGVNFAAKAGRAENLYTHHKLGFSILFPEGWKAENTRKAIVASSKDKNAALKLEVGVLKEKISPSEFIRDKLGIELLTGSEPVSQFGLFGHTGIVPAKSGEQPKRIAVLYQARRIYIITGSVKEAREEPAYDDLFLKSIRSFKPQRVAKKRKSNTIRYVKASDKTTYAGLAQFVKMGKYTEQQLRLLNQDYPRGEPEPGEWIKIVE